MTTYLNWTAPFSFDILDVDPDITYCVDVVNSSSSAVLYSQCGINVTMFMYPYPFHVGCKVFLFNVTPVNIVGNGTVRTADFRTENGNC